MNRVYKVIRNAEGNHIAVAENAKSAGKTKSLTILAAAIISAVSFSAQANTIGIQTGVNDIAIGNQATSTGKNNIAIGEGAFAAGGTLTEAEAKQLIANSKSKIAQISNTQQSIAQKEQAIAGYLQTIDKVERNQAEINRLTILNDAEKTKTTDLSNEYQTANGIYVNKQKEVDTKVAYLEKLDLNKYGALNETSLTAIAKDVKDYIEQGDTSNSLGDQFYKNYVSAYVDKVARLDYTVNLAKAAVSNGGFYNEKTQSSITIASIVGDASKHSLYEVPPEFIPTMQISEFEKKIAQNNENRTYFNANKEKIVDDIIATNSQIKGMYEGKRSEFIGSIDRYYQFKENQLRLAILQKQTGVMTGDEPDYLAKVNETKRLKADQIEFQRAGGVYTDEYYGSALYDTNLAEFIASTASRDAAVYSAATIAAIRDADTNQAKELKTFLTGQIGSLKQRSDAAQIALTANQELIANYENNIANRQPTPEELLAYQKAKSEEAALIAQRDKLKAETDELRAIQASLEEGKDALAIGANSRAIGDGAVALGANNSVLATKGVALGTDNTVTATESIAIGASNTVSGAKSIAVGSGHQVVGSNSGAFGNASSIAGDNSYALGNTNNLSGASSFAFGNSNTIEGMGSTAIGRANNIKANNSFVIGDNVTLAPNANDSLVFGSNASSTVAGGVAIGNNSLANRADSVSVGSVGNERQIINVKNASSDTDAINLGQMNAGLALKADKTYVDTAIGNIPILDISGKADKSYVDSENTAQNTVINAKANQSDLNATNTTITNNQVAQAARDALQDGLIVNNTQTIAANKADAETKFGAVNERINDTNTVVAQNKADQAVTDAAQDVVINSKVSQTDFVADQLRQDNITAQNKADQAVTDGAQNTLIQSNTQTITANKADSDAKDLVQNNELARLESDKADKSYVDAADQNLQAQINAHNTSSSETIGRLDKKDGEQDDLIAANKADADAKNTATNDRITNEVTRLDVKDGQQDELIAKNNQDAINRDTTTNDRITTETNRLDIKDGQQDELIAANKGDADKKIVDTNIRIDNINQTTATNKAEQELRDKGQDAVINTKVDITDFTADQARQDAALKVESERLDAANKVINETIVTNNENMTVKVDTAVDSLNAKNDSQDSLIVSNTQKITANKAEQALTDNAQNAVINTKVSQTDFVADQQRQDAALKAESKRLDAANTSQDSVIASNTKNITTNTVDIANLQKTDAVLDARITVNDTAINERVNKVVTEQKFIDNDQDRLIAMNTQRFEGLSDRVNSLDSSLSSGIASAMALSAMPTMSEAGAHMITGGSGFFNGSSAVAVGLTGTTESGKYSYKAGGTYTKDGGSGFSLGGGYRWK